MKDIEKPGSMKNEEGRNKKGETPSEAKRRYNRKYYERNRDRVIAAQKAREAALKAAEQERQAKIRQKRLESLQLAVEARKRLREEWMDLGWIVAKMNLEAGMSQKQIFGVLQGLTTKKKIAEWCAKGKRLATLKEIRKKKNG